MKVIQKGPCKHAERELGGRLSKVAVLKVHKLYDPERGPQKEFPVFFKNPRLCQEKPLKKSTLNKNHIRSSHVLVQQIILASMVPEQEQMELFQLSLMKFHRIYLLGSCKGEKDILIPGTKITLEQMFVRIASKKYQLLTGHKCNELDKI